MSMMTIRDHALWPKHIEGDPDLKAALLAIGQDEVVVLAIDGVRSSWVRMAQGKNPEPTQGLKPADWPTRIWWDGMYERRGEAVSIAMVADADGSSDTPSPIERLA